MKTIFSPLVMVTLLALTACASPNQALQTNTPEPPTADACQVPTFKGSDAPSDCFNASGEPVPCGGLDLAGVEAGLLTSVSEVVDEPNLPKALLGGVGYTGFIVTFADPPQAGEDFVLYLYLDLDQNVRTGLDMSSGASALPGIDRLIGVSLPSGESWTQIVAKGGYEAESIGDEAQVAARVVGEKVIVFVFRGLMDDRSVAAGKNIPPSVGLLIPVGFLPRSHSAGMMVSPYTLYVGTTRSGETLDFFNGGQAIHTPLAMTVPSKAQTPVCTGGS